MSSDFISGDALKLMRGTNVSGGWVQRYNVSTGEEGRQCEGCGRRFWRVFLFAGRGKRQEWQKISNKSGMAQRSKLQNLNVK